MLLLWTKGKFVFIDLRDAECTRAFVCVRVCCIVRSGIKSKLSSNFRQNSPTTTYAMAMPISCIFLIHQS